MNINPIELQQIIKEEALRLKKRMMLESEKASILNKLQEMEECEMMEEAPVGAGATLNTNAGTPADASPQIKPEVASTIQKNAQAVVSKLTPEQLAKAQAELQAAGLTGISGDQLKDKVEEMLPMNESTINEAWDKSKIYNWLVGGGLGATAAGLVTMALGSIPTENLSNIADYAGNMVSPTPAVISGIIALALGAIAIAIGRSGQSKIAASTPKMSPEEAQRIIANRKAREMR